MIDFELREWLFSFGPSRVVMIAYHLFLQLWYFLVIGIVLSAAFDVFVPKGNIKWILQKGDSLPTIFIAALLGAISPLGSYSIIPIFVSLLQIGIPLAPVVTFLAASPIVNPFIFFITMDTIGLKMALAIILGFLYRYV